ncbi:hypothetical protein HPP92_024164 [Vanilla planifolia]|uniref:Uncharacterized protein n=1 Tax=Vanilla planifolia TaxID=51239 RepID=A0A835PMK8_VANPL|nr:hypothetical protein HPP92_024497 [Vanilla planifolia]KAG0456376.1 hypothetical protein HPP92_024164 [Vanilla planifolia]
MGAQISKRISGDGARASISEAAAGNIQYTAELSSYEAACRVDPEIQTFDAVLQQRTSNIICDLAANVQLRSLSFGTLREVTGSLLEMNQDVVRVVLDCKKDIWKSPELFELVEEYFENSLRILDFCRALEKCLKNTRDSQIILHLALQHFDEEEVAGAVDGKTKYEKTLEELRHFKAKGDPFTDDFFQAFQMVYIQQLSMLEKLHHKMNKLDKKIKSVGTWRKVSCIIFASAFAALLICSIVAAIVAAPPIAAALAAATSIPLGSMGKWFDSLWNNYQDALKAQKGLITSMQAGTFVVITDLDDIRILVNRLEDLISTLLENAEFVFKDDEAVRYGIEEIRKKTTVFMKSVEDLVKQADQCSRDIGRARTVVLQRIINQSK